MRCLYHVLKAIGWMLAILFAFAVVIAIVVGLSAGTVYVFGLSDKMQSIVFFGYCMLAAGTLFGVLNCLEERYK